jgi:hypothetical protein
LFSLFGKWAWNKQRVKVSKESLFSILYMIYKYFLQSPDGYRQNNMFTLLDLKAFERRLTEVIQSIQPSTIRWRGMIWIILYLQCYWYPTFLITVLLAFISICTAVAAWQWLVDPETMQVSFLYSLYNHLFFTIASLLLGKHHLLSIVQNILN